MSIKFSRRKKNRVLGLEDQVYAVHIRKEESYGTKKRFTDDELLLAQDSYDTEYVTGELKDEYAKLGLAINKYFEFCMGKWSCASRNCYSSTVTPSN
jgi:hypothetical protein